VDPDPAIFVIDFQKKKKKLIFKNKFFFLILFEGTFTRTSFLKIKSPKDGKKQ
jgi:hypothetical protein